MAERSIAAVLKTVEGNTSGGSNPSLSAKKSKKQKAVNYNVVYCFFLLRENLKFIIKYSLPLSVLTPTNQEPLVPQNQSFVKLKYIYSIFPNKITLYFPFYPFPNHHFIQYKSLLLIEILLQNHFLTKTSSFIL